MKKKPKKDEPQKLCFSGEEIWELEERVKKLIDEVANPLWINAYTELWMALDRIHAMQERVDSHLSLDNTQEKTDD